MDGSGDGWLDGVQPNPGAPIHASLWALLQREPGFQGQDGRLLPPLPHARLGIREESPWLPVSLTLMSFQFLGLLPEHSTLPLSSLASSRIFSAQYQNLSPRGPSG